MLEITILSVGTLLLLVLGLMSAIFVAYITYSFSGRIFQALFFAIATVSIFSTLLTGRVLRLGDSGLDMFLEGGVGGSILGKVLLLIVTGVALSVCIAWWLWRFGKKKPLLRYSEKGVIQLNFLAWAFVAFFVAFSLLPLVFAPKFEFHISLVYPLFIWIAILLTLRASSVDPVLVIRQTLGLIVFSSLAAAVFMPSLAMQPGYTSLIPGFDMRLWGVTAHANTLGSVAASLLVMQFIDKPQRPVRHHLLTSGAAIALILTQSKSAIAGAMLGLAVLFAWRLWRGSNAHNINFTRLLVGTSILFFLGALLLGTVWLALSDPTTWSAFERRLDPRAVSGLATFTGRTDIWEYAINRGMENPLFGQGLAMWDLQARLSTGLVQAMHAHNLYLQAFSRSGFVGLAALLLLLGYVIWLALKASSTSTGGSLALLAMFLVRSITEVPLQPNSILGGEFFAFMALLVYVIDRGAAPLKSSVAVCATDAGPGQLKGV